LDGSIDFVDSLPAYKSEVFRGPDVVLPRQVAQQLGLNGKFCLHTFKDSNLVVEAFEGLRRSVRIGWFFGFQYKNQFFHPKFWTKTDWEPPKADFVVEDALSRMRAALFRQVLPSPRNAQMLNPELSTLRSFLEEKQYLVKITDKNLGLAVVSKEWYVTECFKHLSQETYRRVGPRRVENAHDTIQEEFFNHFSKKKDLFPRRMMLYLQGSENKIPKFHVIPKVHKTPWSSRPIVPSHSWITSRLSKVVDHFLQPCLKRYPWVLKSTKDFVSGIRQVKWKPGMYLLTGDVKSMYTNIPQAASSEICTRIFKDQKTTSSLPSSDTIGKALMFIMKSNVFEFQDHVYIQADGLAMGTSCAPVVANLYMAWFESELLPILYERGVVYYGRYIDDIFMIFDGTEDTLRECIHFLQVPDLDISWDWSTSSMPFLDVLVRDEGVLVTEVYQKRLNLYMYIPFSSAHPLRVKKALVKAERTRFAMICNSKEALARVESHFRLNLYRRGYPSKLLDRWFRMDLKPSEKRNKLLMLPSKYNPVWEYINMQKLEDAFLDKIGEHPEVSLPDSLKSKPVLSLKRTLNMYDMYNFENLTILDSLP
jgi:hypothetical protein